MEVQHRPIDRPAHAPLEELEALLEQVASLAGTSIDATAFGQRLLESTLRASAANGAALWEQAGDGAWKRTCHVGTVSASETCRAAFVETAITKHRILWISPGGRVDADGPANDSDEWLALAPMVTRRAIELSFDRAVGDDRALLTEVVRSFAEVAGDYFESRELGALRLHAQAWRKLEAFVAAIHRPARIGPTAYAIANDGRVVAGCDRLSVTVGRSARVAAVSGVDTPDRRSDAVQSLGELAAAAAASGQSRWELSEESEVSSPRRLARAWKNYQANCEATLVEIVVLKNLHDRHQGTAGTLLAEWFRPKGDHEAGLKLIATHAESALSNALLATPSLIDRCVKTVARPFGLWALPKTAFVLALLAGAIAALVLWPADFSIDARGVLRPALQRDVFSPRDGVVRSLHVGHGAPVETGGRLLTLTDPTLDLNFEQVLGELRTASQRLIAVQAARTTSSGTGRPTDGGVGRAGQLAGEEKEIQERLAGLEKQLQILRREQDALQVESPIDGIVLTWEAEDRLDGRPVRRGQRLLTVAQPKGEWLLELHVPDRHIRHVLEARKQNEELSIDFLIATDLATTYHQTVDAIALSTEPHAGGEPSVKVTARLAHDAVANLRPGSTVLGKIYCGTKPIGYVWFHDLIDTISKHVLF